MQPETSMPGTSIQVAEPLTEATINQPTLPTRAARRVPGTSIQVAEPLTEATINQPTLPTRAARRVSHPKPKTQRAQSNRRKPRPKSRPKSRPRPRPSRSTKKKSQRRRPVGPPTTKDLGRWKPIDDLALVINVQQTNDLRMIHRGVKFSCMFTLQELQQRWYALLYEPTVSRVAVSAMRNLHPELVESVQRKALYSVQEEDLLGTIKSTEIPKLEQFQELLDKNAAVFYSARTAKSLQNHWLLLKQYYLLPDQSVKPLDGTEPLTFSEAEEELLDNDLQDPYDEAVDIELELEDRRIKREIRLLENELFRWGILAASSSSSNFDSQSLACLCGRNVRFLMRSKEISFGRDTKNHVVDVDLSLEGPAAKISRRQGIIKLRSNGDFFIANEGKRAILIDGNPLLTGQKTRLANNSTVEVCGLRFIFLVYYDIINAIRQENAKTSNPLV
ncbi:microspherule protein 1-like [Drosophila tropicalis]|uniref:microspherule protein 1-like n=1 Tax=Drosophila tropicalis TaxID=46794 RepID=UPI0035AB9746